MESQFYSDTNVQVKYTAVSICCVLEQDTIYIYGQLNNEYQVGFLSKTIISLDKKSVKMIKTFKIKLLIFVC